MTHKILTISLLTVLFLNSCKETAKQEFVETTQSAADYVVKTTMTDKNGKTLEIAFNNIKGTATFNFNGETIELQQQKSASGIWYKNNTYELRGKGNAIELTKDGEVIFEHKDAIIKKALKNKAGETLDITFNNTTNQVKVYLNGGEQIDLRGEKPASGGWYKNDTYELRGKGDTLELTIDCKTVFKN